MGVSGALLDYHSWDTTYFCDCGLLVPSVDVLVTRLADHEGLAFSRRHDLYPLGLVTLAFHVQVAKRTDVVDLDVRR